MIAAFMDSPGTISVHTVDSPTNPGAGEVIVEIAYAGVCGSDLWGYRGVVPSSATGTGHEFLGRVVEVGSDVQTFREGDAVIAPFMFSDGTCEACARGLQSLCESGGLWGRDWAGAQAQRIRVPFADATLVSLPWQADEIDADLAKKLIPLADVFATGTHGTVLAGVEAGDSVAVVGDGAVGLSAAIAALRVGAARVVVLGEQPSRLAIARLFGAETLLVSRDEVPTDAYLALTGARADRVIECVGIQAAFDSAVDLVRPGGGLGFVGVPHAVRELSPMQVFIKQIHLAGGVAPARHYLPSFVADTAAGTLDVSGLIDRVYDLEQIADAFAAMDSGDVLKAVLRIPQENR